MANTNRNLTVNADAKPVARLSEGTRQALEMYGYAVSAFTGALLVGTDASNVREVTEPEYLAAVKAYKEKLNQKKESTLL